jgi:hypothetical protein
MTSLHDKQRITAAAEAVTLLVKSCMSSEITYLVGICHATEGVHVEIYRW